ncbi:hypothetical protein PQI66_05145 [Corynebacterium sp. USCH3]|uniref:hypothetical protein n=1 Tax=Corynebacterium sp. USCH3 TaxID=3024840 RepID=UPI0030B60D7F
MAEDETVNSSGCGYHGALPATLKDGIEPVLDEGGVEQGDLLGFWRWAYSQTLDNTLRGVLAEYIVGLALGIVDDGVRTEWDAFDLVSLEGVRVEVKSSAHLQSWAQSRPSPLTFSVPQTNAWSHDAGGWGTDRLRQSQVYVFCAFTALDPAVADPLDTRQWEFYVASTARIDVALGKQKSISLSELKRRVQPVHTVFTELAQVVREEAAWIPDI